jgi:hypothetical protein
MLNEPMKKTLDLWNCTKYELRGLDGGEDDDLVGFGKHCVSERVDTAPKRRTPSLYKNMILLIDLKHTTTN